MLRFLAVPLALLAVAPAAPAATWSIQSDYKADGTNPQGPWSFRSAPDYDSPNTWALHTAYTTADGLDQFTTDGGSAFFFNHNAASPAGYPAPAALLHPGATAETALVFTAPRAGEYSLSGTLGDVDTGCVGDNGVFWHLFRASAITSATATSLASGSIVVGETGKAVTAGAQTLAANEVLGLVVTSGGDASCDATRVELTITGPDAPAPPAQQPSTEQPQEQPAQEQPSAGAGSPFYGFDLTALFGPTMLTVEMPDFRPNGPVCRVKKGGKVVQRYCDLQDVRDELARVGLLNVKVIEREADRDMIPGEFKQLVQDRDVLGQGTEAGTQLQVPNVFWNPTAKPLPLRFYLHRASDDDLRCDSDRLPGRLSGESWPGATRGSGANRRYGAQELLARLKCPIDLAYREDEKASDISVERARWSKDKHRMFLTLRVPATLDELKVEVYEDARHPDFKGKQYVSLIEPDVMPTTGNGYGGVVVRLFQEHTLPTTMLAGAKVLISRPDGRLVDSGIAGSDLAERATVGLVGIFDQVGTYRVLAQFPGRNGLTLDGVAHFKVKQTKNAVTTTQGRRFKRAGENAPWTFVAPPSGSRGVPVASAASHCTVKPGEQAFAARLKVSTMSNSLSVARTTTDAEAGAEAVRNVLFAYAEAVAQGVHVQKAFQDFIHANRLSFTSFSGGRTAADLGKALCAWEGSWNQFWRSQPLGNGLSVFDLSKTDIGAIMTPGAVLLPDGFTVPITVVGKDVVAAPSLIGQAGGNLIGQAGGNLIGQAGGNVIATGGGNIVASDGANLISDKGLGLISDKGLG